MRALEAANRASWVVLGIILLGLAFMAGFNVGLRHAEKSELLEIVRP